VIHPGKPILLLAACLLLAATGAVGTAAAAPAEGSHASPVEPGTGAETATGALAPARPAIASSENESTPSWGSDRTGETAPATDANAIDVTYEVDRTPNDVGTVRVNYTARLPENVLEFQVFFTNTMAQFTVESTTNFNRRSTGFYNASSPRGETTTATISYTVEANATSADTSGLNSAETGGWALVGSPQMSMNHGWSYHDSPPEFRQHYAADGEGFAQGGRAFLGPHDLFRTSSNGQSFVLVVPTAADSTTPPADVLDVLENASTNLAVGGADPNVAAFVAPDPIRRGGRSGGAAFWAHESSALGAQSTWLHEYVHTRQKWINSDVSLEIANDTEWFTEASADYYGARLAWRAGTADAESFRSFVATDRYADSVLQDADNQTTEQKNYKKGRRVLAALDVRIRNQTDGNSTLLDLFSRINARSGENWIEYAELRGELVAVTGSSTGNWLDNYTQTTDVPSIPPTDELVSVYGSESTAGVSVTELSPPDATAVEGEEVNVTATVRNDGPATVDETVEFRLDGTVASNRTVSLDPGENTTVGVTVLTGQLGPGTYTYGFFTTTDNQTGRLRIEPSGGFAANRTLASSSVAPNGTTTVTLQAVANGSSVTFQEAFGPAVANATVSSTTVDEDAVTPVLSEANGSEVVVTLDGLTEGDAVAVTYQLSVGSNATAGSVYNVSGNVTSGSEQQLPTDQLTVEQSGGVVEQYDGNSDGTITIRELGAAAADYANDVIDIRALGKVAAAYARS